MEMIQVCKERIHKYASEGVLTFDECPYCKTEMHLEVDAVKWKKVFNEKLRRGIKKGLSRGKLIDSLPRLPWFSEAVVDNEANNPDQAHAHKEWTKENDAELSGLFAENGISTYKVWAASAAIIGRSLYAVERQLRIIMARREFELD